MVARLIADMIRRIPLWPTAFFALAFMAAWVVFSVHGPATYAIAASLTMVFASGPFWIPGRAETPLIPYLPVSRREVWQATWVMSTVFPVLVTTVLKLAGTITGLLLGQGTLGFSSLTLSGVMDFLYAGAGCAVIVASGISNRAPAESLQARLMMFLAVLTLMGGAVVGFALHRLLPTQWTELTLGHVVVMSGCLGLTVAGYFHPPLLRRTPVRPGRAPGAHRPDVATNPGALSGLPRLLAHELAWTSGMCAVMFVTMLCIALVVDKFSGPLTNPVEFLASQHLLIFAPERFTAGRPEIPIAGQLGWYAFFIACVSVRFPDIIRHLRVLPLGTRSVHAILLGWPVLLWSLAWLALALLHLAVNGRGTMTTLQVPLLLALIGISAFAQSLSLRFQPWISRVAGGGMMVIPFARLTDGVSPYWLLGLAAIGLGAAIALNASALSRGATYKRVSSTPVASPGV